METWFETTAVGRYTAQKERAFFAPYLNGGKDCTVRLGAAWLRPSENVVCVPEDVAMAAELPAFALQSLDCLLLPHTHEYSSHPLQTLRAAADMLKHGGRLVLTGFNPHSLWRWRPWFDGIDLPLRRHCLPLPELSNEMKRLGFDMEYGKFMVYIPPVASPKAINRWQFMEKAGDRWWPQAAAVYGLVWVKRFAGVHPLGDRETLPDTLPVALGLAKCGGMECTEEKKYG
ncbi:class I SAM-dependent methyltransferase [Neisseria lisongii]|uniref:Methyltransferase n=1 Tax=Neisseria lisongii TaxID=2912188 RepID=A0AAW5AGY6_9NEIS|nr:methyltransferase [Neisseria lisongii]MCF7528896.1 methyltransferase [Neisseria lisongii]